MPVFNSRFYHSWRRVKYLDIYEDLNGRQRNSKSIMETSCTNYAPEIYHKLLNFSTSILVIAVYLNTFCQMRVMSVHLFVCLSYYSQSNGRPMVTRFFGFTKYVIEKSIKRVLVLWITKMNVKKYYLVAVEFCITNLVFINSGPHPMYILRI